MERVIKRKSLRQLVFTWFFLFTLIPFIILAVIIQNQYQKSINQQIKNRLAVHVRELENLFTKERSSMEEFLKNSLKNKYLVESLRAFKPDILTSVLGERIEKFHQKEVKIYTLGGQVFVYFNQGYQNIHDQPDLSMEIRRFLEKEDVFYRVLFKKDENGKRNLLNLSIIRKVVRASSETLGYMESLLPLSFVRLKQISESIGAEVVFFDKQGNILLNTLPSSLDEKNLGPYFLKGRNTFFEFMITHVPYAFMSTAIRWGDREFLMGIGTSKNEAQINIRKVNYVIVFTFFGFFLFLTVFSFYFMREVIRPIESLIQASKELKEKREAPFIPNHSQTEIAELINTFNEMSHQIIESDKEMKKQLNLLEQANRKIKNTQSQLIQSAKLASLGELVAGIAHELNNPIGFIYSNISHLKNYMSSLFDIIDKSHKSGKDLNTFMKKQDYPYIKKDLPKLIQACEEGSKRAKDIVLGLKSFSRSDKNQVNDFDVNKGLDSTLELLKGEFKNRITIHKNYGDIPKIKCNANQIKQVFMNILNNACQAIKEKGDIYLTTYFDTETKQVRVKIRDTGCGIKKESLEKIFDPFYTTKPIGEGTGLGLSISYGFVKSHKGEITVESQVGGGTTFSIHLPCQVL